MVSILKQYDSGICLFEMKNEQMKAVVTNFGCTLLRVFVKDRAGEEKDVVLGFPSISDYDVRDGSYLGACVGRVANRIGKGEFTLNDHDYKLAINNGPNCLHGGVEGFSYKVFDYEIKEDAIWFHYISEDGEEGFPGTLDTYIIYRLSGSTLKIEYQATCDQDTIVNFTNHSYFNLNGCTSYVGNHDLQVCADRFGCVDENGLFTGEFRNVANSPFDFRKYANLDDCFHAVDEQLTIAKGLDHAFIFNTEADQVRLYSEKTGIEMCVSTSYPLAQIYSANYLHGALAKDGRRMLDKDAICIETQFLPDSIHAETCPKVILRKDDLYQEWTEYKFGIRS